ncbi:hypothetical protein ACGFI3_24235 [Nonomuraea wenchangensis]|uniref:hypothetical protein n=1 Tax=Nonomuraea wenchangensis TaxID=568860 RepID=UPI0037238CBA
MIRHLAEATGRDLCFEELTPGQTRQEWGTPGSRPNLSLFQAFKQIPGVGDADVVDMYLKTTPTPNEYGTTVTDTVEQGTGRPPRTFARWAVEHARHFRP